jgi:hypothetical protein
MAEKRRGPRVAFGMIGVTALARDGVVEIDMIAKRP